VQTETVVLDESFGKEYAGKYVVQEITRRKRLNIIAKYTRYSQTGAILSTDMSAIDAETLWAALKEQPASNPISLEKLLEEDPERGVPNRVTSCLIKTVNKLKGLSAEEVKNS